MTEVIFTATSIAFFVLLCYSIENLAGNLLMENSLLEILTYYVIGGALLIGAPGVFFFIVFQPALQNTKGRMVGYKDHKTYGDSSIYENSPSDTSKFLSHLRIMNERAERINGWAAMIGVMKPYW